jgi:hypothetical protein
MSFKKPVSGRDIEQDFAAGKADKMPPLTG